MSTSQRLTEITAELTAKRARKSELEAESRTLVRELMLARAAGAAALINRDESALTKVGELEVRQQGVTEALKLLAAQIAKLEADLGKAQNADEYSRRLAGIKDSAELLDELTPVMVDALGRLQAADAAYALNIVETVVEACRGAIGTMRPLDKELGSRLAALTANLRVAAKGRPAPIEVAVPAFDTIVYTTSPVSFSLSAWRGDTVGLPEYHIRALPRVVAEAIAARGAGKILPAPSFPLTGSGMDTTIPDKQLDLYRAQLGRGHSRAEITDHRAPSKMEIRLGVVDAAPAALIAAE